MFCPKILDVILAYSNELSNKLDKRMSNWSPQFTGLMGDIFLEMVSVGGKAC